MHIHFTNALNSSWLFNMLDEGVANALVLKTYRLGVSVHHYSSIWNDKMISQSLLRGRGYFLLGSHMDDLSAFAKIWVPRLNAFSKLNVASLISAVVAPIIKIRSQSQLEMRDIELSSIGLHGTLVQGLNRNLFKRIKKHPMQFVYGLAQITTAVALSVFLFNGRTIPYLVKRRSLYTAFELTQVIVRFVVPILFSKFLRAQQPQTA
jgi:hypothetical protein